MRTLDKKKSSWYDGRYEKRCALQGRARWQEIAAGVRSEPALMTQISEYCPKSKNAVPYSRE
jgi:hypothetical protein